MKQSARKWVILQHIVAYHVMNSILRSTVPDLDRLGYGRNRALTVPFSPKRGKPGIFNRLCKENGFRQAICGTLRGEYSSAVKTIRRDESGCPASLRALSHEAEGRCLRRTRNLPSSPQRRLQVCADCRRPLTPPARTA